MPIQFYNTLTRKKEEFFPIKKGEVGYYSCGPTVYWYQHIGNLKAYLFADLLKKVLRFNGYKVKHVINVTDVGHLTSDADEGEDKMEKAAKREGKSAQDIANYYLKLFKEDFKELNIEEPDVWCKATEHIKEQIELIKRLEKKGFTYKTQDGIYFDTSKFPEYGKIAKINKEGLEAGKRVEMRDKRNVTDFALWKFSSQPGLRQQEWPSPWGLGFPGWHIECSAMSMKYLGESFDIHSGGEDHVQVHHANEIAQSEAATGKKFVNYWLHEAFLLFKGEKVSKSKGGLFTIPELKEKGFDPLSYRYLNLTAHYRTQLNFSLEILQNSQNTLERLRNIASELKDDKTINEQYLTQFKDTINDDLNTPKALSILWEMLRDQKAAGKYQTLKKMDEVLGLKIFEKNLAQIPHEIQTLVKERETARKNKNFKLSDELRNKIQHLGWQVSDSPEGQKLKKI